MLHHVYWLICIMAIQETGFIGPVRLCGNANELLFTKNIKDDD